MIATRRVARAQQAAPYKSIVVGHVVVVGFMRDYCGACSAPTRQKPHAHKTSMGHPQVRESATNPPFAKGAQDGAPEKAHKLSLVPTLDEAKPGSRRIDGKAASSRRTPKTQKPQNLAKAAKLCATKASGRGPSFLRVNKPRPYEKPGRRFVLRVNGSELRAWLGGLARRLAP